MVCSGPNGKDFKRPENEALLERLLNVQDLSSIRFEHIDSSTDGKRFPRDVPDEADAFSIVWFAGCNLLHWILSDSGATDGRNHDASIPLVHKILKDDGYTFFTEHPNYHRHYKGRSQDLTMGIEEMTGMHLASGTKDSIISNWKRHFDEIGGSSVIYRKK